MPNATDARVRWIGGASLLALLATLLLLAARTPGGAVPEEDADAAPEAAMCGGGNAPHVDVNAAIDELVQDTRSRLEQEGAADSDLVVLNNRGYNYGGAPNVRLDSFLVELDRR